MLSFLFRMLMTWVPIRRNKKHDIRYPAPTLVS